jgi:hypothetical protein
MHALVAQTQSAGIRLDPFRGETLEERALRMRRYADHVRASLTDDDARTLEESRLHALR